MRVVGGEFKGRALAAPDVMRVRLARIRQGVQLVVQAEALGQGRARPQPGFFMIFKYCFEAIFQIFPGSDVIGFRNGNIIFF